MASTTDYTELRTVCETDMFEEGEDEDMLVVDHKPDFSTITTAEGFEQEMNRLKKSINLISCYEPNCDKRFKFIKAFRVHLEQEHEYDMPSEKMSFSSMEEFENWRLQYEEENSCNFVKRTGSRLNYPKIRESVMVLTYLYCSRSGMFQTRKKSAGKFNKKTLKSGVVCTASIIYRELSNGEISVVLYPEHYGHDLDVKQLRLSKSVKNEIAHKLALGKSPSNILDEIHTGAGRDTFKRKDLVSKSEIKMVEKNTKCDIGVTIPDSYIEDDFESLDIWCAELAKIKGSHKPILFYKPLGYKSDVLSSYDLCLVLMTEHMGKMLECFGNSLIYLTNFNIPKLHYFASILFVIDEFNTPFPVFLMVSNKFNNNHHYKVMFENLKTFLDTNQIQLKTKIFMSDRCESAFSIWNKVMQQESAHIISPRFIDGEWRKYLATITNEDLQGEIYDQLCDLLEPTLSDPLTALNRVVKNLESNDMCAKFHAYFKKSYIHNFDQWNGSCIREILNINKSINFEKAVSDFQETLEAKYKKYAKSIVKILQYVLKKVVSYQYDRAKRISMLQSVTDNCHRGSLQMDLKNVYPTELESVWRVVLGTEETVSKVKDPMKCLVGECSIQCKQCAICLHKYECTCNEYKTQSIICNHIHLVMRMIKHTVLYDVLNVTKNQPTKLEESESVFLDSHSPEEIEGSKSKNTVGQDPLEAEDDTSIRKTIIQTLVKIQDHLYLIHDESKLKTFLNIVEEVHNVSSQMVAQVSKLKEKKTKVGVIGSPSLENRATLSSQSFDNAPKNSLKNLSEFAELRKVKLSPCKNSKKGTIVNKPQKTVISLADPPKSDSTTQLYSEESDGGRLCATNSNEQIIDLPTQQIEIFLNNDTEAVLQTIPVIETVHKTTQLTEESYSPKIINLKENTFLLSKNMAPNHIFNFKPSVSPTIEGTLIYRETMELPPAKNMEEDKSPVNSAVSRKVFVVQIKIKYKKHPLVRIYIHDKSNIQSEIQTIIDKIRSNEINLSDIFSNMLGATVAFETVKKSILSQLANLIKTTTPDGKINIRKQGVFEGQSCNEVEKANIIVSFVEILVPCKILDQGRELSSNEHITPVVKITQAQVDKSTPSTLKRKIEVLSKEVELMKKVKVVHQKSSSVSDPHSVGSEGNHSQIETGDHMNETLIDISPQLNEDLPQSLFETNSPSRNVRVKSYQNKKIMKIQRTVAMIPNENSTQSTVAMIPNENSTQSTVAMIPNENSTQSTVAMIPNENSTQSTVAMIPNENSTQSTVAMIPNENSTQSTVAMIPNENSTKPNPCSDSDTKLVCDSDDTILNTERDHLPYMTDHIIESDTQQCEESTETKSTETSRKDVEDSTPGMEETSELVEKTVPRRVVRIIRPQMKNGPKSNAKGSLKVLKPCTK